MRVEKPSIQIATARIWAREGFGIEGELSPLPGEVDRNFLLLDPHGKRFVLKISPVASLGDIESQVAVLTHLENSPVEHVVPRLVRGNEGKPWIVREDHVVRVVGFVDGIELARAESVDVDFWRDLGSTLALLDLALADFDHPGTRRQFVWDLTRLLELEPLLEFVEPDLRSFVGTGLRRFRERVVPRLDELPRGVIHNDANDYNVLVKGGRLAGIIDFGDMVHTITAAEPAIACTYAMMDRDDPWWVAEALLAGYEEHRPLESLERDLLPDLIVGRLCNSLLLSSLARRDQPDDEYLTISERPAAALLKRLIMEPRPRTPEEIVDTRRAHLGRNLSISYREPLKIVRGKGQYLFDHEGRRYLDLVNNVCHVGHCHPRVVEAGQRQMAILNTNSRYLHDALPEYVERLTGTMPDPLSVCFLVCTGTEANDLALRLARAHTGNREILVLDHAYHGHSPSLIEISAYKCEGPGGEGMASHARKLPAPDVYRGLHGSDAGAYVAEVKAAARGGAFLAESLLGCGGQIVPPDGFLSEAHAAVHAAGGVCIADEVQVGFGRVGTHMWAFEALGGSPDIVTLGKPIGNGHPLSAVITTTEVADSFDTGMEYFNTFGGNPVSCAIGLAVLDVIESERLQAHALELGIRMKQGLEDLAERHELIGDVRGLGLFLGVELVTDRERKDPAARQADEVIERMKARGFLLSTDGPNHNVIKIKPPMVLTANDVDAAVEALDETLRLVR